MVKQFQLLRRRKTYVQNPVNLCIFVVTLLFVVSLCFVVTLLFLVTLLVVVTLIFCSYDPRRARSYTLVQIFCTLPVTQVQVSLYE